jgi:pSer/pThr/pTyr-binding forkhead associated (FHA) protein
LYGVLVFLVLCIAEQGRANMELKLIVLAGAKEGTQIPLKKDKFIIGRASECTLRAGSSAISRRHCAIVRKDDVWLVRDLGSRNGTFLNDLAVEKPTPLKVGDEIRVGPLHFRVEPLVKAGDGSKASKPATEAKAATPAEPVDVKRGKQPPAKDVSEVVQRTAGKGDGSTSEEDISRWLLGIETGGSDDALRETQTLSMEETTSIVRAASGKPTPAAEFTNGEAVAKETEEAAGVEAAAEEPTKKSGGWGLFKLGKKSAAKKSPGKLPPRPSDASKDSREAAADILREMTRRR